jgi:hypothetical protein
MIITAGTNIIARVAMIIAITIAIAPFMSKIITSATHKDGKIYKLCLIFG